MVDGVSSTGIESPLGQQSRWETPRFQMNIDGTFEEVSYNTSSYQMVYRGMLLIILNSRLRSSRCARSSSLL